jgi:hypothetical protein
MEAPPGPGRNDGGREITLNDSGEVLMSKQAQDDAECQKVLVDAEKVCPSSLPRSLRHSSKWDALREADEILAFLETFTLEEEDDKDFCFDDWSGLRHVLDLVRDKIAIGAGEYKFPLSGSNYDDPLLVERGRFQP